MMDMQNRAPAATRHELYSDIHERMKHFSEVESIAQDIQRPVSEIAAVYEEVLGHMRAHARITDFLLVLVSKKVRERYRMPH